MTSNTTADICGLWQFDFGVQSFEIARTGDSIGEFFVFGLGTGKSLQVVPD